MRVRNTSGRSRTIVPAGSKAIHVEDGESVDVDDDLGRSLLDQTDRWVAAGPTDVDVPADAVLAQVRNDKGRARTALEKERGRDKPRKGLVNALTKIIESEED